MTVQPDAKYSMWIILVGISLLYLCRAKSLEKTCHLDYETIVYNSQKQGCGILSMDSQPEQCETKCHHRGNRVRPPQRFGRESPPELHQAPASPDFTEDTVFCLAMRALYYDITGQSGPNISYTVRLGGYTCTLEMWNSIGQGMDVWKRIPAPTKRFPNFLARFSLQLYGRNDRVQISTNYLRYERKSWSYTISKTRQRFPGEIAAQMAKCLDMLVIEGTHKFPSGIPSPHDRCTLQHFRLSYPSECTSMSFDGGWKRGQKVVSASWAFSLLHKPRETSCVDVTRAEPYDVVSTITNRYINVEGRQLRPGLNRICNQFLFTGTFGTEGNYKDYGPYDFKICGYFRVEPEPCVILRPVPTGQAVRLPVGDNLTLDARDTVERHYSASNYRFQWRCHSGDVDVTSTCHPPAGSNGVFVLSGLPTFINQLLTVFVDVTFSPPEMTKQRMASKNLAVKIVAKDSLRIEAKCLSNCKKHALSVISSVISAECLSCDEGETLNYQWTMQDYIDPPNPRSLPPEDLIGLATDGDVTSDIISLIPAGNSLLERVLQLCVEVTSAKSGIRGSTCVVLDFRGAPLPLPGDRCIISPHTGQPGFFEFSYSGLCSWRSSSDSLLYYMYTYDVGLPERQREYQLVASSDLPRLSDIELPFGNPDHDWELGIVFNIENPEGLTYIFNVNDEFRKRGIVFKVRKPMDYTFFSKVEKAAENLVDRRKSAMFGTRQGKINVAGLITSFVDNDAHSGVGLDKDKREKIRESVMTSLTSMAGHDVSAVVQLTPIMDKLTRVEDEISDDAESKGAEVLVYLTKGLTESSDLDYKTAAKLSRTLSLVLDRLTSHNLKRQQKVSTSNVTSKTERKPLVERAANYSKMYVNVGVGLAVTILEANRPQAVINRASTIVANWVEVKADSVLSVSGMRSNDSTFGSSMEVEAAALNITSGTKVNIIMTVTESNLFAAGKGASAVNMPMVTVDVQNRANQRPISLPRLAKPVDVFIERKATTNLTRGWKWQRINLTKPVGSERTEEDEEEGESAPGTLFTLLEEKTFSFQAATNSAVLLRFNLSHTTFSVQVSAFMVNSSGARQTVFENVSYPRTSDMKSYKNLTQLPEVLFLPPFDPDFGDNGGRYGMVIRVNSTVDASETYTEQNAPHLMMLLARLTCQSWNASASAWVSSGCKATEYSNFEMLHCQCTHLSVFSGGILVSPNPIDLFDVGLYREFFSNPAVVSIVIFIWLAYFIMVYWAKDEDWLDTLRSRVAVLEDNQMSDTWAYLICCVTGWWINSGTTAKVFIYLKGTRGMSRVHRLTDDEQELFVKGAENWFILTTPSCLGRIKSVVVWHDSSGLSPAWFLKEVFIQDINTGRSWHCMYNDWISVEHGSGDLCVEVPSVVPEEIHKKRLYQTMLMTSQGLRNRHIWLSILLKPCYSPFTRVQRVTCALCILLTTMLSSLMFYGLPSKDPKQQANVGPLRLNMRSIIIGVQSAFLVMPINMLLVSLFTRTSRRPPSKQYQTFTLDESEVFAKKRLSMGASNAGISVSEAEASSGGASYSVSGGESSVDVVGPDDDVDLGPAAKQNDQKQGDVTEQGLKASDVNVNVSAHTDDPEGRWSPVDLAAVGLPGASNLNVNVSAHTDDPEGRWSHLELAALGPPGASGENGDARVLGSSLESAAGIQPPDTTAYPGSGPGFWQEAERGQRYGDPLNSNNSANKSGCSPTPREPNVYRLREPRPSRSATAGLGFIRETAWFQNAVTYLRNNINRLMAQARAREERRSRELSKRPLTYSVRWSEPRESREGASSFRQGSYFDQLRARKRSQPLPQNRRRPEGSVEPSARPSADGDTQSDAEKGTPSYQAGSDSVELKAEIADQSWPQGWREHQQGSTEPSAHPNAGGEREPETRRGTSLRRCGSYFDKLKAKTQERPRSQDEVLATTYRSHLGAGDQALSFSGDREGHSNAPCWDALRDGRLGWSEPDTDSSSTDEVSRSPVPRQTRTRPVTPAQPTCWFCGSVPGQQQTLLHLRALSAQRERSRSKGDRAANVSDRPGIKDTLKKKMNKLRNKAAASQPQDEPAKTEPEEEIPFDVIRRQHDSECEKARAKGARALKMFKRRAAQCIAEDFVNSNANVEDFVNYNTNAEEARVFESSTDKIDPIGNKAKAATRRRSYKAPKAVDDAGASVDQVVIGIDDSEEAEDDDYETTPATGGCQQCAKATFSSAYATFMCLVFCDCPKAVKLPWWSIYLTWTFAMCLALGSSWVVTLYGFRMGYQRSVDWLVAFFTGFFNNAFLIAPCRVMVMSLVYIVILHRHVNFREEAAVKVHDENSEFLHVKMLRQYEARRRMLDGMWATMDYAYPVPRSKAMDIKLRLAFDSKARRILRESLIWTLFLITVAIVCRGHTTVEDTFSTNTAISLMLEKGVYADMGLADIAETDDVWEYMNNTVLGTLYAISNTTAANGAMLVLGSLRIRQIRQASVNASCDTLVPADFTRFLSPDHCVPPFSIIYEDKRSFGSSWDDPIDDSNTSRPDDDPISLAWTYRSALELQETLFWGQRGFYPGGGYTLDLPKHPFEAQEALGELKNRTWLDRDTRALMICMNIFTPSKDLISRVFVTCEWSAEGPIHSTLSMYSTKLHLYSDKRESTVTSAEFGWMIMLTVNMYYEMQEIIRLGVADYLHSGWTYLELLNFLLSIAAIELHMATVYFTDKFRDSLSSVQHSTYVSFAIPSFLDQTLTLFKSLIFVLVVLKVFKVLRFNRYFRILLKSFVIARDSIMNYAFIALILLLAFATSCLLLFRPYLSEYKTLASSASALLNFGLGEGDYFGWTENRRVLGPILYISFIASFTIISLSFFITFIMEGFNVSRVYVQLNTEEQHVVRYLKRLWQLLVSGTPKIKQIHRRRRTHPFKVASYAHNPQAV